jgi:hypothetical protein
LQYKDQHHFACIHNLYDLGASGILLCGFNYIYQVHLSANQNTQTFGINRATLRADPECAYSSFQ